MTTFTGTGGDDTVALQAAIAAAAGGVLECRGVSMISAQLLWDKPARIDMRGFTAVVTQPGGFLRISPVVADPNATPPVLSGSGHFWCLKGVKTFPITNGLPGYGIDIDLGLGQWVSKLTIKETTIGQFAGCSIHLKKVGDPDGLFCSVIEDNVLLGHEGALAFEGAGDSIIVQRNTMTGPGFGVYEIGMPGAAQRVYQNNNITAQAGAFILQNANQTKILCNQMEAVDYTGALDAMVYIDADSHGCDVIGNNMNNHGNCTPIVVAGKRNNFDHNVISVTSAPVKPHMRIVGPDQTNCFDDSNRCMRDGVKVAPIVHINSTPTARKRASFDHY
jgi:hypothetical protein